MDENGAEPAKFANEFHIEKDPVRPEQLGLARLVGDDWEQVFKMDIELALVMLEALRDFLGERADEP